MVCYRCCSFVCLLLSSYPHKHALMFIGQVEYCVHDMLYLLFVFCKLIISAFHHHLQTENHHHVLKDLSGTNCRSKPTHVNRYKGREQSILTV